MNKNSKRVIATDKDHPLNGVIEFDGSNTGTPRTGFFNLKVEGFSRSWYFQIHKESKSKGRNPNRTGISRTAKASKLYLGALKPMEVPAGTEVVKFQIIRPARVTDQGKYEPMWFWKDIKCPLSQFGGLMQMLTEGVIVDSHGVPHFGTEDVEDIESVWTPEGILMRAWSDWVKDLEEEGKKFYNPSEIEDKNTPDQLLALVQKTTSLSAGQKAKFAEINYPGNDEVMRSVKGDSFVPGGPREESVSVTVTRKEWDELHANMASMIERLEKLERGSF